MSDDTDIHSFIEELQQKRPRRGPRTRRAKKKSIGPAYGGLDEAAIMSEPSREPILGLYGVFEWIHSSAVKNAYEEGRELLGSEQIWLTPAGFDLTKWVREMRFTNYVFHSTTGCVIRVASEGDIYIDSSKGKINVRLFGTSEFCDRLHEFFAARFKKAENLIRWVYNGRGDDISVPLNYRPALQAAYPWIKKPVNQYIKDYLDSDATVLILIGPPGTGKTTFIKNIIQQSGGGARVAYDEKVLSSDDFFAMFIDGEDDILVMEDADSFLASRQDGNTMMHKFLNVSDGLISSIGKKLIFSTNLPNINDIDSALLRKGRCYDIMQFRPLTRQEALAVLDEAKSDRGLEDGSEFTLAEIFNQQPSGGTARKGIGFM